MITQREISKTAFRLGKQDRIIEKDYVLTWILFGIVDSTLADTLAFKGGTALKKAYFEDYRFSEDLDFTVMSNADAPVLLTSLEEIVSQLALEANIILRIDRERTEARQGSLTTYVDFVGPLQGSLGSRDIKMDFTFDEEIVFTVARRPVFSRYSDSEHLHKEIRVYSLEEVLIEKLCAIIGRTEPRDLFDIHYLLTHMELVHGEILEGFARKANNKGVDPDRLPIVLREREPTIARLWRNRLELQVDDLPQLDRVLRETRQALRKMGLK